MRAVARSIQLCFARCTVFRNSANNVRLIIRKLSALTVETRLAGPRDASSCRET